MEEYLDQWAQESHPVQPRRLVRLWDLLYAVKKRLVLIVICALIGLAVGIALSLIPFLRGEMPKQYAITSSIAVTSQDENGLFTTRSNSPNSTDIYLAENMVDAVIYVMKSDQTLNAAIHQPGLPDISAKDISRNLSMSQYNGTQIIEMTLYWHSANEGVEILEAINAVSPGILVRTLKIGNVSVINAPTARQLIGGGLNTAPWIYMVIMGVMLGVGFAVWELLLRPKVLNAEDMERCCQVEVLGEIPNNSGYFRKKQNPLLKTQEDEQTPELLDNYVSLAHILKARLSGNEHSCVYVTSAARNEGRTTVSAHLAVQLAEIGMKVLAVDFDSRNPRLGSLFLGEVDEAHSINALCRGNISAEEAIIHLTANLDLLPSVLEQMPLSLDAPLLDSISHLKQQYDIVLMDTAPVGLEADTMRLNRLADMALLVVRFDGVTLKSIQNALGRLDKSGMHILGSVVNCVQNSSSIPVCRSQRRASRAKTGREQNRSGQPKKTEPASSSSGSSGAP